MSRRALNLLPGSIVRSLSLPGGMLREYQKPVAGTGLTQHLGCVLDRREDQGPVAAHPKQGDVVLATFTEHCSLALSDLDCAKTPPVLRADLEHVVA